MLLIICAAHCKKWAPSRSTPRLAMMEIYLYLTVMPIVAYLVTARRSGVWKGRQIIWPTVRNALSGTAMLVAIILWKLWWHDSEASSVIVLLFVAALLLFLFFFLKALIRRIRSQS
jgi:preprotein translocase subunit SecE